MSSSDGEGYETKHGVTVQDVRYELGNPAENDLGTDLITYHLKKAERNVLGEATSQSKDHEIAEAIAVDAAYRAYTATDEAFLERSSELDLTEQWDAQTATEALEKRRAEAIDDLVGFWSVTR